MKNTTIALLIVLFCTSSVCGQIGFSVGYKHMSASNWENLFASYNLSSSTNQSPLKEGTDFAVDYWFRLKKKRIEFHPEISYSRFIRNWSFEDEQDDIALKANFFNFSVHTNIYPLDFKGDCNCPTFSKDGDFLEKGFFIQVSPVVSYLSNSFDDAVGSEASNDITFGLGLGLGIDFGLSDFITITPVVRYSYLIDAEWKDLDKHLNLDSPEASENNVSEITNIYVGFRLGFRFDELNKYGYR